MNVGENPGDTLLLDHSPPIVYTGDRAAFLQGAFHLPLGLLCSPLGLARKLLRFGLHLASDLLGGASGFVTGFGGLARYCFGSFCYQENDVLVRGWFLGREGI